MTLIHNDITLGEIKREEEINLTLSAISGGCTDSGKGNLHKRKAGDGNNDKSQKKLKFSTMTKNCPKDKNKRKNKTSKPHNNWIVGRGFLKSWDRNKIAGSEVVDDVTSEEDGKAKHTTKMPEGDKHTKEVIEYEHDEEKTLKNISKKDRPQQEYDVTDLRVCLKCKRVYVNQEALAKHENEEHKDLRREETKDETDTADDNKKTSTSRKIGGGAKKSIGQKRLGKSSGDGCLDMNNKDRSGGVKKKNYLEWDSKKHVICKKIDGYINFSCAKCPNTSYTRVGNTKKHFMAKHSGVKYKCKTCGNKSYRFDRTDVLKHHILTVHGSKYINHYMYEVWSDSEENIINTDQVKDNNSADKRKEEDNSDHE